MTSAVVVGSIIGCWCARRRLLARPHLQRWRGHSDLHRRVVWSDRWLSRHVFVLVQQLGAASAALAIAPASAVAWLEPQLQTTRFVIPVAIGSVVVLALVNSRGARAAGGLSVATVLIKIVPLFAVIAAAALRTAASTAPGGYPGCRSASAASAARSRSRYSP